GEALTSFRDGLAIAATHAKTRPADQRWQTHLRQGVIQLGILSDQLPTAKDFASALAAADEAIALAPDMIWLYKNRAHALMFLDRTEEARALSLQYRGRRNARNDQSWDEVMAAD